MKGTGKYPRLDEALKAVAKLLQDALRAERIDRIDLHLGTDSRSLYYELTWEPREEDGAVDLRSVEELAQVEADKREIDALVEQQEARQGAPAEEAVSVAAPH